MTHPTYDHPTPLFNYIRATFATRLRGKFVRPPVATVSINLLRHRYNCRQKKRRFSGKNRLTYEWELSTSKSTGLFKRQPYHCFSPDIAVSQQNLITQTSKISVRPGTHTTRRKANLRIRSTYVKMKKQSPKLLGRCYIYVLQQQSHPNKLRHLQVRNHGRSVRIVPSASQETTRPSTSRS